MKTIPSFVLLAAAVVGSSGCIGGDPWQGMWLFRADPNTSYSGTCTDNIDPDAETTYLGESIAWVDIYQGGSSEYIVLLGAYLVGSVDKNTLTATWDEVVEAEDYATTESIVLSGTLEGGVLTGTVETYEKEEVDGQDDYDCRSTTAFSAERSTSDPDSYDVGEED